jgi:proton glutamate symport protein
MKNKLLWALIVAATVAIGASLLESWSVVSLPTVVPVILRWAAIALLAGYAGVRRSLTAWILVGLAAGAELGHDWPSAAEKVQFLGTIFLRLIKVIIAPLLFGTLVVGIAGHADLKKVGRLGIKSLVYFEIVSVITLVIGFAAINISRAGEGVHLPPVAGAAPLNAVPHTAA